jgi:hypothetical protein
MTRTAAALLAGCVLIAAGIVAGAAAQDRTAAPGQPTKANVWIQNRGENEAIPVRIQTMAPEARPVRVQITGTPAVTIDAMSGPIRRARQTWEYQTVTIAAGQEPTAILNAAGAGGWETAGLALPAPGGGALIVMKRPQ